MCHVHSGSWAARFGRVCCAFVLITWVVGATSPAQAGISFVDSFRNNALVQTGNGNTLSPNGSFFSADLTSTGANDYNAVQMIYPGPGSPQSIPQTSATTFHYQTPSLANQAAMDTAFPFGTYQFQASNGGPADTTSYNYTSNDYARSLPFLTGTNFTDLQGMDSSKPFTFMLSPFTTGGQANFSFIFLTIFDFDKNAFVFNDGFLAPTTTSVVLPANTLTPNHHFAYEVDFSNRDLVPSSGAQFDAQLGFDVRTSGLFSSAPTVPEPSTLILSSLGMLVGAGLVLRPRKAVVC
jgi:hypothetical protein